MVLQVSWQTSSRSLALVIGAAALWATLERADWPRTMALATSVGVFGFFAVLVPQGVGLALETLSWRGVLSLMQAKPPLSRLLRVRAGTEALAQSLPGGPLVAESVTPSLLRDVGVEPSIAVASQVARRHLLIWSQGAYAALLLVFGFSVLQGVDTSARIPLGSATALVAVGLLATSFAMRLLFCRKSVAEFVFDLAARLVWGRAAVWLAKRRRHFTLADAATRLVLEAALSRRLVLALPLVIGWACETAETFLITRMLGLHWAFAVVGGMELLVALVRHLVFFVPAGLGVQDAGYVLFFHLLGAPDPSTTGAAFSLLKRAKELCWIVLGYLLLAPELLARRYSWAAPSSPSQS